MPLSTASGTPLTATFPLVDILTGHSRSGVAERIDRLLRLIETSECREGDDPLVEPYKVRQRLGEDIGKQLAAAYAEGMTSRQLGQRFGLAKSTVLRLLADEGVAVRIHLGLDGDGVQQAVAFYESGKSLAWIAGRLQVSSSTVRLRLLEAGVQMRDCRRRSAR